MDGGPLLLDAQVGASRSGLVLATMREALLLAWLTLLAWLLASDVVEAVWEDIRLPSQRRFKQRSYALSLPLRMRSRATKELPAPSS